MRTKTHMPKPIDLGDIQNISPDELYLDPKNPRLTGQEFTVADQTGILRFLWQDKEVSELVDSIAYNGYWQQEVLFVTRESGKFVVVEGNRRLAAVKLLRSPEICQQIGAKGVRTGLRSSVTATYDKLPVIVCTRIDLWMYMGFKHLNGPQEWDSIAKAEYIARVHEDFKVPLPDIAGTIGDRHDTVRRLYQGLAVLRQAERAGVFRKDNVWGKRFPYSHLWTGLGYSSIQKFLGIKAEAKDKPDPVPAKNISRLGELCLWLFGSKDPVKKPLIKSQNPDLRKLSEVLESEKGYAALSRMKDGEELEDIWRFSRGDETMLLESLVEAEKALREAHGYLPTGYTTEKRDLLQQGKTVLKLAEAICVHMDKTREAKDSKK
jgi:hypothetical protein